MEGSSAKTLPGQVKSGSCQQVKWNVEMDIPGLVLETSEKKGFYSENKQIRKKGKMTYPGYSMRDSTPTPVGPEESRTENEASPEEACSRKPQVLKNVQSTGETWQLRGDKWVEIRANKSP